MLVSIILVSPGGGECCLRGSDHWFRGCSCEVRSVECDRMVKGCDARTHVGDRVEKIGLTLTA
jgi:hypothetical protein